MNLAISTKVIPFPDEYERTANACVSSFGLPAALAALETSRALAVRQLAAEGLGARQRAFISTHATLCARELARLTP